MTEKILEGVSKIFDIQVSQDNLNNIYKNQVQKGFELDRKNISDDFYIATKKFKCENEVD